MDIKQLTYFVQIAIEENYSAASRKLYISQPALSKVVKNLEQELGIKLFYSSERKTKLTDEGREFFIKAQKLIEDYHALIESAGKGSTADKGRITLGMPPIVGTCFLSPLVSTFQKKYPLIDITIVEKGANALQEDVFTGAIDIACVILPISSNQFDSLPIIAEKNALLVPDGHWLSENKTVNISDLEDETFVLFNEEFTLYRQVIAACREAGFEPNIAVATSQWDFIVELVRENRGISILPKPILQKFGHQGIRLLDINHLLCHWDVALISKKGHYMSSACKKFIDYVKENIQNH